MELKKAKSERERKLQRFKLLKARAAGAYAFVVNPENWGECKIFLEKLVKKKTPTTERIPQCLQLKLEPSETRFFTTP